MRLLHINASYKPAYIYGGPTMSVSKLCEEMAAAGCEVEVFTTTANGTGELNVTTGHPVTVDGVSVTYYKRISKDHTHYSPDLLNAVRKNARRFDVIHIHAWWNLVSMLACRIAIKHGVPVVVSPRGTLSPYTFLNRNSLPKQVLHSILGKQLLRRCFIHVTSAREQAAMETLVRSANTFEIPNFIALPKFSDPKPKRSGDVLKLIFFSRIEEKKGLDILLNALATIDLSFTLTVAGDGDPQYVASLRMMAERNGINRFINWTGFVSDQKFELLRQHDLLVLPSHDENFGNVVIESLSTGTAVLIINNVGLAPFVEAHEIGWVIENDPSGFRRMISVIAADRTKLETIASDAPGIIAANFDENALRKKYLTMYQEITGHGAI